MQTHILSFCVSTLLVFLIQDGGGADDATLRESSCSDSIRQHIVTHLPLLQASQDKFMTEELPPFLVARPSGSSQIAKVRNHIKSNLKALNWTVERDISNQLTVVGFKRFVNIIATQDVSARKRITLACHYDSKLLPIGFKGAMDSAVPCAMLVNLAKVFNPIFKMMHSNTTIQLLFLDGEEAMLVWTPFDSLYGSRNLAKVWASKRDPHDPTQNYLKNIDAFILLRLIGHKDTLFQRFYRETDHLFSQLVEFEACLQEMGILERSSQSPLLFRDRRRLMPIEDDQAPFRRKGLRKIMHLITYPFPSTWHKMSDDLSSMDTAVIHDFNKIFGLFVAYVLVNAM